MRVKFLKRRLARDECHLAPPLPSPGVRSPNRGSCLCDAETCPDGGGSKGQASRPASRETGTRPWEPAGPAALPSPRRPHPLTRVSLPVCSPSSLSSSLRLASNSASAAAEPSLLLLSQLKSEKSTSNLPGEDPIGPAWVSRLPLVQSPGRGSALWACPFGYRTSFLGQTAVL